MTEIQKYGYELKRKTIHLLSTIIPVIYFYTSKEFIIWFVGIGLLLMILIDFLKAYNKNITYLYKLFFHDILRPEEKDFSNNHFTGGTYYAAGIFLSLVIFPMEIAINAILVLIWCDTAAALIGIKYGKIILYKSKTLEGSTAFVITGIIICFILNIISPDTDLFPQA